jgi:hypothetical protein
VPQALKTNPASASIRINEIFFMFKLVLLLIIATMNCPLPLNIHGTGSYPPGLKGLQRRMRHAAMNDPLNAPCL